MSPAVAARLRAVSFGTVDGALWATAVDAGAPALVLGTAGAGLGQASGLTWSEGESGSWRLSGDALEITVTPLSAPMPQSTDDAPAARAPDAGQQLCRVQGTATVAGSERALDCVGTRIVAETPTGRPASARLVSAWFDEAEALTLLAARPRGADHQDADAISSALFDAGGWIAVNDPRLSTTYDASGVPTRCNLELWIGEGENEFPRRVAGEVAGPGGSVAGDGMALRVSPLHCHSRGRDGAGVYVLATF